MREVAKRETAVQRKKKQGVNQPAHQERQWHVKIGEATTSQRK
jgi:hypothetical protein